MNYFRYTFTIDPLIPGRDLLIAEMAEIGFEAFEDTSTGVEAYIQEDSEDEKSVKDLIAEFPQGFDVQWEKQLIQQENWNAVWESSFVPIEVGSWLIRAPFHEPFSDPSKEVIITPQMSFGTGHHDTTWMMSKYLLENPPVGLDVADVGSGTAVLAIFAEKLGAKSVYAVDIDDWSVENGLENCELNKCSRVTVEKGSVEKLTAQSYNLILANINRNVLMEHLPGYAEALRSGGILVLSGFFPSDVPVLRERAEACGLIFGGLTERNGWASCRFSKA